MSQIHVSKKLEEDDDYYEDKSDDEDDASYFVIAPYDPSWNELWGLQTNKSLLSVSNS